MDSLRPKRLNPLQRLLVARWFMYWVLANVALFCVSDVAHMTMQFLATPWDAVGDPAKIAVRLVAGGVFFELRGKFVEHLLGGEAARVPEQAHLSEVCEVYGGYLTVAGLFVELTDSTREFLDFWSLANPVGTFGVLLITAMSLHVMFDLVRAAYRGPSHEAAVGLTSARAPRP